MVPSVPVGIIFFPICPHCCCLDSILEAEEASHWEVDSIGNSHHGSSFSSDRWCCHKWVLLLLFSLNSSSEWKKKTCQHERDFTCHRGFLRLQWQISKFAPFRNLLQILLLFMKNLSFHHFKTEVVFLKWQSSESQHRPFPFLSHNSFKALC